MTLQDWQVTLTLGLLLAAALLAGGLGELLRLPKVTSYLLAGVLLGLCIPEQVADGLTKHDLIQRLTPLTKLAIALVLFTLGCHFPLARARRILRRVIRLSAGELGTTFVLVGGGLLLLGVNGNAALMLAALALATAPATTILVLKENEAEGVLTEYTNTMVAMNNLTSIVLFELLLIGIFIFHGQLETSLAAQLGHFATDLLGSILLGIVAGLAISFTYDLVAESRRLVLLVAAVALVLGICLALDMPYLLTFLAMGMTVANSSYQTRQMLAELDRLTGLLCVVFFVTHGAELELGKLAEAGMIGVGYLVLRSCGKYFGTRIASHLGREEPAVKKYLGTALLAQAGAAIALSEIAIQRTTGMEGPLPRICEDVQTVILGTVVVFEIVGPLLIRHAVLKAGEVPLAHAIYHPGISPVDQLRAVFNRVMLSFGRNPWNARAKSDLNVGALMRRNVPGVRQSATFDTVIDQIEHSRDNTFPVVDAEGSLVGVIRYRELSNALFDDFLSPLVRAADIATPAVKVLHPDDPVDRASGMFAGSKDDCIPVVTTDETRQFLGVVRRRDVMRLQIRTAAEEKA